MLFTHMVRIVFKLMTVSFVPTPICASFPLKFNLNDTCQMKTSLCASKCLWKNHLFCFLQGGIWGFGLSGMSGSEGSGPGVVFSSVSQARTRGW